MFEALALYVVLAVLAGAAVGWRTKDGGAKGPRWAVVLVRAVAFPVALPAGLLVLAGRWLINNNRRTK